MRLMGLEATILRVKRAETTFYRSLKRIYKVATTANLPVPNAFRPVGKALYELVFLTQFVFHRVVTFFFREPLFRCRCESVGKRFQVSLLPHIYGHTRIFIGDDVSFYGALDIFSGRTFDNPILKIGNKSSLGHQVSISCNLSVEIGDNVAIAGRCSIFDNDGHPIDMEQRMAGLPAPPESVRPVRIGSGAWIGINACILKGVTIGRGAIIGSNSVVTTDIPDYAIAAGSPAKVIRILTPSLSEIARAEAAASVSDSRQPKPEGRVEFERSNR
jgi:acetyltransferase-like isoleucine patch superfamily enzyme